MWQAEYKLYLYPVSINYTVDLDKLQTFLKKVAFISKDLGGNRFSTGNKFVSHLTFMGCSPSIELEPQTDKPYCYIEIETGKDPRFIFGENIKKSKCPHCRHPIIPATTCPHCTQEINPQNINWRKTAFTASSWISIGNIYELEAIPNDLFLNSLEEETGVTWKPAYIRKRL